MRVGTFTDLVDRLRGKKKQYQATFGVAGTPGFEAVKDLAIFCRAFKGEVIVESHEATLIAAGRREAFFRIFNFLHLEPDELVSLYKAAVLKQGED